MTDTPSEPRMVPLDENYQPKGYAPGPDDPGPITDENVHGDADTTEPLQGS